MRGQPKSHLGDFEELVLLAILRLGDNAYGVSILDALEDAGRPASIGQLHTTLDRMREKGFVSSRMGDPTPERGGRAKRFYKVEGAGMIALEEAQRVRSHIRHGLDRGKLGLQQFRQGWLVLPEGG